MDRIKPIQQDPWISENTTVDEKYKIHKMLSAGGFGQVYWGTDMTKGHYVAMKVEKKLPNDIPILALEAASMSEINKIMKKESIGRNQLVRLYDYLETSDLRILVMPLYGPNIRELKKSLSSDHFSLKTSLWLMKKMIGIIKILHAFGWVHRDIKPANFCIGLRKEDRHKLYLVDFGMAKTYQHENGSLKSKRHDCSFCGTARYASLDIHKGISFCRNDDLWSLYYITIENIVGQLPWRHTKDYKEIERMKESINLLSSVDKICNVPTCLYKFKEMLDKSSYYETPRYDFALQYIRNDLSKIGYHKRYSYSLDWEIEHLVEKINVKKGINVSINVLKNMAATNKDCYQYYQFDPSSVICENYVENCNKYSEEDDVSMKSRGIYSYVES